MIASEDSHPFSHTESIALAMTTQRHEGAIPIRTDDWNEGGSNEETYISPWYVTTINHRDFDRQQGTIRPERVSEAIDELHVYTAGK